MSKPKCTCGRDFRSPTDYKMAYLMGMDVEDWHAIMDLWEETLEGVLEITQNMTDEEFYAYIEQLKEAYGNLAEQASADQEDS